MVNTKLKLETKEVELAETLYVRDIDDRVFQAIVAECLTKIKGVALVENNLIDNIFSLGSSETIKGIHVEQNGNSHSVNIKIEVYICYGESIPEKAEEIQNRVTEEVTQCTGLHISSLYVRFRDVITEEASLRLTNEQKRASEKSFTGNKAAEEEYSEEF